MNRRSKLKRTGNKPKKYYTIIPNALARDAKLKPRAKVVALYLWSLPNGWELSVDSIAEATGLSRKTVAEAIRDLIAAGWMCRDALQNRHGLVYGYVYVIRQDYPLVVKITPPIKNEKESGDYSSTLTSGLSAAVGGNGKVPWNST